MYLADWKIMNLKSNYTSCYMCGCSLHHSVGHQRMAISNLPGLVKSSYFSQQKLLWDSFISSYRGMLLFLCDRHCFGWDYSKTWMTICSYFSLWSLSPWLAHTALTSSSHQYLTQHHIHVFKMQESSLFHFFRKKKSAFWTDLSTFSSLIPLCLYCRHCSFLQTLQQFVLINQFLLAPAIHFK